MGQISSKELAISVCKALADKRGKDIVALYVREKRIFAIISSLPAVAMRRRSAPWASE